MRLSCYSLHDHAPRIVAGRPQRQWMGDFRDRHPYRCLPLTTANSHGWEILCPVPIEINWNGGPNAVDVTIKALKPLPGGRPVASFCRSHFTQGLVTFHLDYIFRTDAGWNLLVTGPLNRPKANAYALAGVVETDWLPHTFTMNWQILQAGRVEFDEDEPFCVICPVKTQELLDCVPEIRRLSDDVDLRRAHDAFRASRDEFMERFRARDPLALKQPWQKHYFLGRYPDGTRVGDHINKLRLSEPCDRRKQPAMPGPDPAAESTPIADADVWREPRCPLNLITTGPCARNDLGRRRLDRNGNIVDWNGVHVVRSEEDAAGYDFIVKDGLLAAEKCDELARAVCEVGRI